MSVSGTDRAYFSCPVSGTTLICREYLFVLNFCGSGFSEAKYLCFKLMLTVICVNMNIIMEKYEKQG